MALAVNDIVQITDVQSFLDQVMLNVYFYRIVSLETLADYSDVAEAFDNIVRGVVTTIQALGVNHPRILVQNLTNGVDIHEQVDARTGENGGDGLASFYALGFRLVRTDATTRHGSKRIGGIPEAFVVGNALQSTGPTLANNIAAAMAADIVRSGTVDHDLVAEPVIVGRFPEGHAQEGQLNLAVINPVQAAQFIRVTTQTTRRAGRGV